MIGSLLLVLALSPTRSTWACATDDDDLPIGDTLLDPAVIAEPEWAPFFYTAGHAFYTEDADSSGFQALDDANRSEWSSFFAGAVTAGAWDRLLEKGTVDEVAGLTDHPGSGGVLKDPRDPEGLRKLTAALDYLMLAKQADQLVPKHLESWEYSDKPDTATQVSDKTVGPWLERAEAGVERAPYAFLKQRYAFQVMRILFFHKRPQACIDYFQSHHPLLQGGSIGWRAMGFCAGALFQLKHYAESNYLYSLIYDRCPELKLSAYWSFHPQEEADWKRSLALAVTPREKEVLWQMMGLHDDGLRAMQQIYALDPRSDLLTILLSRETNMVEATTNLTGWGKSSEGRDRLQALATFVDRVARARDTREPYAWTLVSGHLHAMQGDAATAQTQFDAAQALAPGRRDVAAELRLERILAQVMALQDPRRMTASLADELIRLLAETRKHKERERSDNLLAMIRARLNHQFTELGDPYMALIVDEDAGKSLEFKEKTARNSAKLQRLLDFLDRRDKKPVERFAAACFPYSRNDLIEAMGMDQLYRGRPEKAAPLFARIQTGTLPGDPFVIHIKDCHDCDHEAYQARKYTKAQFVDRVLELEARARRSNSAADYFTLGNAFYNITYFGNARRMYMGNYYSLDSDPRVMSTRKAQDYYLLAMGKSQDPEFRAKCAFMAAKCEQADMIRKTTDPWGRVFIPSTYFKELATTFSHTRYFQEVLQECGYFQQFLDNR